MAPTDALTPAARGAASAAESLPGRIVRSRRHRRPSGEPPPLPRRLNASGKYWLALAVGVAGFWAVLSTVTQTAVAIDVFDHRILVAVASLRTDGLTAIMRVVGRLAGPWPWLVAWWGSLLVMLVWRRWRQLFVWIGAMLVVSILTETVATFIQRPRPVGIEILGPWKGFAMPSIPVAVLAATLVNMLYALVPRGRLREVGKWVATVVVVVVAFSRLYLAQDGPTDVLMGAVIGVAVPLVFFRLLSPGDVFPVVYRRGRTAHLDVSGARHDAIVRALEDQLGVIPIEVVPFGLAGSGGSTPLRVKVKGDPDTYLLCKLYAATHVRADRWYKLGRTLLYGRLEDEKAFNTVRRLVQHEDYALRLLHAAGLPVPTPLGIVEITPEREYLVVMEFFDGACEIGEAEIDDAVIDQGLRLVRRLWDAGLAHRDIKPANLLVRDGRLLLIDPAFAEVRPSPWRQAVDLANMMLVLALRSDAQRVYERARVFFTDDEIAEAFAATRGLTMPSQLRRMIRAQGRDLHAEFTRLLPRQLPPVRIQRWSARRVALLVTTLVVVVLAMMITIPLLTSSPLS